MQLGTIIPLEWLPYYLNLPLRLYDYDDPETYEKADELVLAFDAFKDFFRGTALDEDDPKMQMTNLDFLEMTESH